MAHTLIDKGGGGGMGKYKFVLLVFPKKMLVPISTHVHSQAASF